MNWSFASHVVLTICVALTIRHSSSITLIHIHITSILYISRSFVIFCSSFICTYFRSSYDPASKIWFFFRSSSSTISTKKSDWIEYLFVFLLLLNYTSAIQLVDKKKLIFFLIRKKAKLWQCNARIYGHRSVYFMHFMIQMWIQQYFLFWNYLVAGVKMWQWSEQRSNQYGNMNLH